MLQCARILSRSSTHTASAKQVFKSASCIKPASINPRWKSAQIPCRSLVALCKTTSSHIPANVDSNDSKLSFAQRLRASLDRMHTKACVILLTGVNPDTLVDATTHPSETPSGSDVIGEAASYVGDGKWIDWIRTTRPVQFTIHSLEYLHTTTGLGWAPTFVLAAIITRVCILPLVIYQARVIHEISRLRPHFAYIKQLAAKSQKSKITVAMETTRLRWLLYRKYKCHPVKLLLPGITQLGVLACVAVSIRPLIYTSPSIQTAGVLWLTDLTMPDPWFVLPITISAFFYVQGIVAEHFSKENAARKQKEFELAIRPKDSSKSSNALIAPPVVQKFIDPDGKIITVAPADFWDTFNYYKGAFIIVVMPFAFSLLPSGLAIFQLTGAIWSLAQLTIMQSPAMKIILGLHTEMRPLLKPTSELSESDQKIRSDIRNLYSKASGKPVNIIDPTVPPPITFYTGKLAGENRTKPIKSPPHPPF